MYKNKYFGIDLLIIINLFYRKPVYLEAYNSTVIRYITVNTSQSSTDSYSRTWNVALKVYFEATPKNKSVSGTIAVNLNTDITNITESFNVVLDKNEDGEIVTTLNLTIPAVSLNKIYYQ